MTDPELVTLAKAYAVEFGIDELTATALIKGHAVQLKPLPLLPALTALKRLAMLPDLPRERGRHVAAIVAECGPRKFGSWIKDDDGKRLAEQKLLADTEAAWKALKPKDRKRWIEQQAGIPDRLPSIRERHARLAFAASLDGKTSSLTTTHTSQEAHA
jgi:hypothetical protein